MAERNEKIYLRCPQRDLFEKNIKISSIVEIMMQD